MGELCEDNVAHVVSSVVADKNAAQCSCWVADKCVIRRKFWCCLRNPAYRKGKSVSQLSQIGSELVSTRELPQDF